MKTARKHRSKSTKQRTRQQSNTLGGIGERIVVRDALKGKKWAPKEVPTTNTHAKKNNHWPWEAACGAQTLLTVWGCLRRVWLLVSWSFGCWFVALFNLFYDRTYSMGCHQGKDPTARLSRRGCNKARPATSTHVYCSFFCSPLSSLLAFSFVLTPIFFQNSSTKQQQQNLLAVVILHHEDRFPSFHPSGRSGLCSFT